MDIDTTEPQVMMAGSYWHKDSAALEATMDTRTNDQHHKSTLNSRHLTSDVAYLDDEMARLRMKYQQLRLARARLLASNATEMQLSAASQAVAQPEYVKSKRITSRARDPQNLFITHETSSCPMSPRAPNGPPNNGRLASVRAAANADQKRPVREAFHSRQCPWPYEQVEQTQKREACFKCRKYHEKCTFSDTYMSCGCCERCRTVQSKGGHNRDLWAKIKCRATSVMDICPELILCKGTMTSPHRLLAMDDIQDELRAPSYRSHHSLLSDVLGDLGNDNHSWWIPQTTNDFGKSILPEVIRQAFDFERRQSVKSPLVLIALLCFRDCQNCLYKHALRVLCAPCDGTLCGVGVINDLARHLAIYLNELNTVLRDSDNLDTARSLSVVYSLFIMAYVQRALQTMEEYLGVDRPSFGASAHYFDDTAALFGAMEKEDTLIGGKMWPRKKSLVHLGRRISDSGSDRSVARNLFTEHWKRLGICTTYQFLERHMKAVCDAHVDKPRASAPIPRDDDFQDPTFFMSVYGADMETDSILAPSMTNASTRTSTITASLYSPSIVPSEASQLSPINVDFSPDNFPYDLSDLEPYLQSQFGSTGQQIPFEQVGTRSDLGKATFHGDGAMRQAHSSMENWWWPA